MIILDNLKLATIAISNLATGGSIGTAIATVDIASSFAVNQTTANQVLTIPNPTDALAGDQVTIANIGTASFTILGKTVQAGQFAEFVWNGTTWSVEGDAGRNMGAVVTVASLVAGNNTITHNLSMPTGSFSSVIVRAYNATGNEITCKRVMASDTANAIVISSPIAIATATTFQITPLA
jgi:hypothetical protein